MIVHTAAESEDGTDLICDLLVISAEVADALAENARRLGLGPGERAVLLAIQSGSGGRGVTPTDIVRTTGATAGAVSKQSGRLEAAALVFKEPDRADSRSHFLQLTELGKRAAEELVDSERALREAMLAGLSPDDLRAASITVRSISIP